MVNDAPPSSSGEFHLQPGPGRVKLTQSQCEQYGQLYGKGWRQIRRWSEIGAAADDQCPLSEPAKMPAWWARRMKWRVPQEILDAAARAQPAASAASAPPALVRADNQPVEPPAATGRKINLEDIDPDDGDRLRELKQLLAAKFRELKEAMAAGQDTAGLEAKYLRNYETMDKIESRAIERMKKQGRYILRDEVDAAIAANAELLRQSHESMQRRVLERCSSLTAEQRREVAAAIDTARASEIRMLARLGELSDGDLELELAA